ncbi:hypothetical protein U3516DRAFT_741315 [Neocallimastix sp. 'constans']
MKGERKCRWDYLNIYIYVYIYFYIYFLKIAALEKKNNGKLIQYFIEQEDYVDLIEHRTQIGEIELQNPQWLIQNGADINSKSESELHFHHHSPFEDSMIFLEVAFQNENFKCHPMLIGIFNSFSIKNDWGKKKVMITVKREILKLKIGAVMFNKMNQIKPYSSLYVGFDHHHYKIAEYLFEYGGNSKELDPSKLYFIYNLEGDKSIIRSMFKKENLNMMRTLLHQQKHKNSQPFNINRNLDIVKLLVENGTNSMVQMIVMVNQFRESATHISYRV